MVKPYRRRNFAATRGWGFGGDPADDAPTDLGLAHPAMQRMLHALWSGLHLGINTDDLVTASGLSRSQAWAVFGEHYGCTPSQALADARLSLAERLLATGAGVADTALRCGYASADSFARAWKRRHGAPPSHSATPSHGQ